MHTAFTYKYHGPAAQAHIEVTVERQLTGRSMMSEVSGRMIELFELTLHAVLPVCTVL
jgi:hypothetical protein